MSFKQYIRHNLTVPNVLTAIRILIIPPMARLLLKQNYIASGALLLLSALSDLFDGFIARKFDQITDLGKILDPIADKLTLIAVVMCMSVLYPDTLMFIIVLFVKEILMLCGGAFLLRMKIKPPAARWYGKVSTTIFYTSIITLVVLKAVWGFTNHVLSITLIAVTTVTMLFSLTMYFMVFVEIIKEKKSGQTDQKTEAAEEHEDMKL